MSTAKRQPVLHRSLTDQIAIAVKQSILRGELAPGERLVEQTIARTYGVGQNAVREALIALAHQGFVRRVANRATYVTQLSLQEAQKLSAIRAALEGLAVESVRQRFAAGEISVDHLDKLLAKMRDAAELLDRDAFYEFDLQFHQELWMLSGNEYLEQMLEQVVVPLFAFFILLYFRKGDAIKTLREAIPVHEQLLQSIRSGHAADAKQSLDELVDLSVKHQRGLVALP